MKYQRGVSIIELIIFIIVMGILGLGILMSFNVSLEKTIDLERSARALTLAQSRLEIILGQYELKGFDSFTDICDVATPPAICDAIPSGYTLTSTITANLPYKTIAVSVTGLGHAALETEVSGY